MKPNILFLSIDSLRSDKIYGKNKSSLTPNIDNLIKNGTYFSQATSTSDTTGLSIGSLITAIYPFKTGITHFSYNSDVQTFFQIFKDYGYQTYATVPDAPFFLNTFKNLTGIDTYVYDKRDSWLQLIGGIGNQIIEQLEKNFTEPWLYYIHLMDLHAPFFIPKEFNAKKYGDTNYDQMISSIDFWIGKFLEKIDLKKTIVIISADHGDHIPIVDNWNDAPKSHSLLKKGKQIFPLLEPIGLKLFVKYNEIIRKNKINKLKNNLSEKELLALLGRGQDHLYDELIQIPLIFTGFGIPSNKIILEHVKQVDIFPTIADLLDLTVKNDTDGKSLVPLLTGNFFQETPAYIETGSRNPKSAKNPTLYGKIIGIRTSKYKYWRSRNDSLKNVTLFDLEHDPKEENNIASNNPSIVNSMEEILNKMKKIFIDTNKNKIFTEDENVIEEELKKLGYL